MFKKSAVSLALAVLASAAQAHEVTKTHYRGIDLRPISTYETGIFDEGAAEISAYDARSKQLFITNANDNSIDILDIRHPRKPEKVLTIDLSPYGGGPNSVAVFSGVVAVAVEAEDKQAPGKVLFFNTKGKFINAVTVGALPDMLTFSSDGSKLLVANEGEPNDDYTIDPEGSVSIIDMTKKVKFLSDADVATVSFTSFNGTSLPEGIRIYGPNASVAQDLEPEYIALSHDDSKAYVTLQENNALAIIDIATASVDSLVALGTKDHSVIQNAIDASNRDDVINIQAWPVVGMYMPDTIASYEYEGKTYLLTANEGDSRDYDGYSEEERVKDLVLDETAYPDAEALQQDENIGRLKTSIASGDIDGDGDTDLIHAYGARSFSIWDENGTLVYDSGSDFERITADLIPADFNSTNDENGSFDDRSDDKGAEPEGVTVGVVGGQTYAFIGLERVGGIMVYNVTNPVSAQFIQYINNRDFAGDAEAGTAGDLGPEGLLFIPARKSPNRKPLLVVTNEVSGTTTIYQINKTRAIVKGGKHH